ncbi:MAG: 4Fe-4S binding protein [Oscillospiraceae bacterium]|nr:4Fe-4S binding protein [Oscillospiraceae bacterium]
MAYKIGDNCVKCGECADACPLGIITEGDERYVIDADQCVDCGTCESACTHDAITQE